MGIDPDSLLQGLDEDQRRAAVASAGPVRILAGAGTGKTRTITHRIAYGVHSGVYVPSRVLALTFTAKAAGEMRNRLRALETPGVQVRTFHAAALRQLQFFWPQAVGGNMPRIVEHKAALLGEAATSLRIAFDRAALRDVAAEIERAKVAMVSAPDYMQWVTETGFEPTLDIEQVQAVYEAYEKLKAVARVIDFEDVLWVMAGLIREEASIAREVRGQYRHFVVDEYQDVSLLQQVLLEEWLGKRDSICVVGDPSQTIYSFSGATPEFLTNFTSQYSHAVSVTLARDYRSTPQIVAVANHVISPLGREDTIHLVSQEEAGPAPTFTECVDDRAEAEHVARRIARLVRSGVSSRDIAVLFRINSQSVEYEQELTALGIAYTVRGAERFFSRKEVREALLLIRGAARSGHDDGQPVVELVSDVLSSLGWAHQPPPGPGAAKDKWDSLEAVLSMVREYEAQASQRGAAISLAEVSQFLQDRAENQHAPDLNGVVLASIHAAKGLEWPIVFVVGCSDDLLPISMATEPKQLDEERRLFYVAVTRAAQQLHFSWSSTRFAHRRPHRKPSRFIADLLPNP